MAGTPVSESELWDLINEAWERMSLPQKRLWEAIRIDPERWTHARHGRDQSGFWVVGLIGRTVIWYNDLEDGFERSTYVRHGEFVEFGSLGLALEHALQHVLNQIELGHRTEPHATSSIPGEYVPK